LVQPWDEAHLEVHPSYRPAALAMTLPGMPYPFSGGWARGLSVFHAPDHHIPRLRGTPVIATVMDIIPLRHPEWVSGRLSRRVMNWLFGRLARDAAHVVTISEFSAADIADGLRIPRERISAIPLGVDPSFFSVADPQQAQAALQRYGLSPGYFLFVGTLQPRKNLGRILQAHRSLPREVRQAHPLVVVGRDGWGNEALAAPLAEAIAEGFCHWLKYVPQPDLPILLRQSRALVYPSLFEGFGLPVVEAFAAGTAVVSANTTSIPEVAADAALLVDPTSLDQLRHAMLTLAQDDALRAELVRRGAERARRFSWETTVQATLAVYRRFADV
jgi:glycosyltransferase involved in cell wall biosynthesis